MSWAVDPLHRKKTLTPYSNSPVSFCLHGQLFVIQRPDTSATYALQPGMVVTYCPHVAVGAGAPTDSAQ